jgi:hypothetical protein
MKHSTMRRAPALLFISLAACGSGNSGPLFGGFTPSSGAAVILAPATCNNIGFIGPAAMSGILIDLTSGSDACNVLTQAKQCGTGSGSTTLLAGAFSGVVGGSTVAPADPGTYPWLASPPSGAFKASTTTAAQVDAACTSAAGSVTHMSGGSVVISTVTASRVSGSMDLHFDNGQAYMQPFDVAVCPVSIDICSLFSFCASHTCVQP